MDKTPEIEFDKEFYVDRIKELERAVEALKQPVGKVFSKIRIEGFKAEIEYINKYASAMHDDDVEKIEKLEAENERLLVLLRQSMVSVENMIKRLEEKRVSADGHKKLLTKIRSVLK